MTQTQAASKEMVGHEPPVKEPVVAKLSFNCKVKMVESVKPAVPLIIYGPDMRQSGESLAMMDRVNESQDFSDFEDQLNMNPCL